MEKQLVAMTVTEFVDLLASDTPAPGGGSVAALAGAQAAALAAMVCRLTIGKKKYAAHEAEVQAKLTELESARTELLTLVDADTEAYRAFGAAMAMPKDTDEQKAARTAAMRAASKTATEVPAQTMRASLAVARLVRHLHPITNQNCRSDIGTALQMARAAVLGAVMNVLINLPGTGDDTFNQKYTAEADAARAEVQQIAMETGDAIFRELA